MDTFSLKLCISEEAVPWKKSNKNLFAAKGSLKIATYFPFLDTSNYDSHFDMHGYRYLDLVSRILIKHYLNIKCVVVIVEL